MHWFLKFILEMKLYTFRAVPLSIIRSSSLYTQQWYISYRFADSGKQDQDGTAGPSWSCSQAVSKHVWHIPLLRVQWKTPDDGQSNCPKHADFNSKNKFEKLVHLVGFIIRNLSRCAVTWMPKKKAHGFRVAFRMEPHWAVISLQFVLEPWNWLCGLRVVLSFILDVEQWRVQRLNESGSVRMSYKAVCWEPLGKR